MHRIKDNNYYKWSIDKGDYDRDSEATLEHVKKTSLKKRIKLVFLILLYSLIIAAVSYMLILHL